MPAVRHEGRNQCYFMRASHEVSGLRHWNWQSWEEMEDCRKCRYVMEDKDGKQVVKDRVEHFVVDLDRVLVGIG